MSNAVSNISDLPVTDIFHDSLTCHEAQLIFPWLDNSDSAPQQAYYVKCINSSDDLLDPTPYSYNTMLTGGVDLLRSAPNQNFPVMFDSGASNAISGFKEVEKFFHHLMNCA